MRDLFYLSETQFSRIKPYFPLSHGVPRVDDLRVISGIIYVIRNGLQWKDAPREYGPHKTLYNRFVRWSRLGMFNRISSSWESNVGLGRRLRLRKAFSAWHARYFSGPPLRAISLDIVEAARPSSSLILRRLLQLASPREIISRSSSDRQPDRRDRCLGFMPPW
jgi:transposase